MSFLNWKNLFSFLANKYETHNPIIGLDVVGRGVRLMSNQPYELKDVIFTRINGNSIFHAMETGKTYCVPENYEVNENPPPPANQAQAQIIIEESWENFEQHFNIETQLAASHKVFSVDVKVGQIKQLYVEEDSYYAAKTYFIPFWSVYLPNVTKLSDKKVFKLNLPTLFKPSLRKEYNKFFERYGTHYIKRAWIGGKVTVALRLPKSTALSKSDIRKALNACYTSANKDMDAHDSLEKLQKQSEFMVLGQGGDPIKLDTLSSLDEAHYNEWLATLKENPKVIEFEAVGIWSLISDENKAQAMLEAYQAATIFTPLSALLSYDSKKVYLIRGKKGTCYDIEARKSGEPKQLNEMWPSLLEIRGFETIDTILKGTDLKSSDKKLSSKLFLLRGSQCVCLDIETKQIDEGYPKPIAEQWPGVTFERVDAILSTDFESVYFFMGSQYIRYNPIK